MKAERRKKHTAEAGGAATRRAAQKRAEALRSLLRDLCAAGIVTLQDIAEELNKRHVPTARGGRWHRTTVSRLLVHLGVTEERGRQEAARLHRRTRARPIAALRNA